MARTQAADYEQRRLAILDRAAELYAQEGFLGSSLAQLGERCRMSKSLIYHYYSSKEEILFDVMASHVDALNVVADDVEALQINAREKLHRLTHAFVGLYVDAAAKQTVLLNELDALPPDRRTTIVARQRRLITLVERWLIEIQPRLEVRRRLARPATMLYFGQINWMHTWFDPKGAAAPDEVAELAVTTFLRGLDSF